MLRLNKKNGVVVSAMGHMRWRILINSVLLCVGIVAAFALGELFARLIRPISTVEYQMEKDVGAILVPNQRARWVSRDYDVTVVTNSAGFHDVEHAIEKPNDVYRIVVLGDSFMEALQVSIGQGYTQTLERMLQQWVKGKRVEVINLGISGTGPSQYYSLLKLKGLRYKPDLVLMTILPDNDFRDSYQSLSGAVNKPFYFIKADGTLGYVPPQVSGPGATSRLLLRQSALLLLVRQSIASRPIESWLAKLGLLAPSFGVNQGGSGEHVGSLTIPLDWYVYLVDPPSPWPDAYRVTLRMIQESKEIASQHGARFLVMLIGSPAMGESRWKEALEPYQGVEGLHWDLDQPYRAIKRLGERSEFQVVSLVEPFRNDFQVNRISHSWAHDGHWNPRGHQLAAEAVSSYLCDHREAYGLNARAENVRLRESVQGNSLLPFHQDPC